MSDINREGHKLLFKGEEYRLDQILNLAKSGPPIEVKLEELNLFGIQKVASEPDELNSVARHCPPDQEYQEHAPVFFKYEGKYVVLLGHEQVRRACLKSSVIKGKLISGPVLKKARIEKPVSAAQLAEQIKAAAPTFNAPRFTQDTRRPPQERRGISEQRDSTTSAPRGGTQHKRYAVSGGNIIRKDPRSRV